MGKDVPEGVPTLKNRKSKNFSFEHVQTHEQEYWPMAQMEEQATADLRHYGSILKPMRLASYNTL